MPTYFKSMSAMGIIFVHELIHVHHNKKCAYVEIPALLSGEYLGFRLALQDQIKNRVNECMAKPTTRLA